MIELEGHLRDHAPCCPRLELGCSLESSADCLACAVQSNNIERYNVQYPEEFGSWVNMEVILIGGG